MKTIISSWPFTRTTPEWASHVHFAEAPPATRTPNMDALQVSHVKVGGSMVRPAPADTNMRMLSRATAYRLRGKGGPAGKGGK